MRKASKPKKSVKKKTLTPQVGIDIICGRAGGKHAKAAGNQAFRRLVFDRRHYYENADKRNKMMISDEVVQAMHLEGRRFLILNGSVWQELSLKQATEKTSQTFRDFRTKPTAVMAMMEGGGGSKYGGGSGGGDHSSLSASLPPTKGSSTLRKKEENVPLQFYGPPKHILFSPSKTKQTPTKEVTENHQRYPSLPPPVNEENEFRWLYTAGYTPPRNLVNTKRSSITPSPTTTTTKTPNLKKKRRRSRAVSPKTVLEQIAMEDKLATTVPENVKHITIDIEWGESLWSQYYGPTPTKLN